MPNLPNLPETPEETPEFFSRMASFHNNPTGFVFSSYPWGQEGTRLAATDRDPEPGPDKWQMEVLDYLGHRLQTDENPYLPIQIGIRSGHGAGKGAIAAWIVHWFMNTRINPQITVTANTVPQLEKRTWRELNIWHNLLETREWFQWTATKYYLKSRPGTWFAAAMPWSAENSEAFAGQHEEDNLIIFDEASAIDDKIWEVAQGAETTGRVIWIAMGNPTQTEGRFRECWRDFEHRWKTWQVDTRFTKKSNKELLENWIQDYGIDSDYCKVRITGDFPSVGVNQFIDGITVNCAVDRMITAQANHYSRLPYVLGVDVAREGSDFSAICVRQGSFVPKIERFNIKDTAVFTNKIIEHINIFKPKLVFVDEVGIGGPVIDSLRMVGHQNIIGVKNGNKANNERRFADVRAETWDKMKKWLQGTGCIPKDKQLKKELEAPQYSFDKQTRLRLERKEDMKLRGHNSPDLADALAMTFFQEVVDPALLGKSQIPVKCDDGLDKDPYDIENMYDNN